MSKEEEKALVPELVQLPTENDNTFSDIMMNPAILTQAYQMAEQMVGAELTVPEHLRKNVGDCYAIVLQSLQWRLNPFIVAQKTFIVSGKLGYEAQLVVAVLQASGAITGGFKYEYSGDKDTLQCRAGAILKGETEVTWGSWLASADVTVKNSPLWKTNPEQQMSYLQSKNWARLYCPGAILGVYTPDELEDMPKNNYSPNNSSGGQPAPAKTDDGTYDNELFDSNYPKWKKSIQEGARKAETVISYLAGNYKFTPEQEDLLEQLRNCEPIDGEKS